MVVSISQDDNSCMHLAMKFFFAIGILYVQGYLTMKFFDRY